MVTINSITPPSGSAPWDICSYSPDLWVADNNGNYDKMTTGGVFTQYASSGYPLGVCVGPDSNLWFTDYNGYVWKVTTGGSATGYALTGSVPNDICAGPDGNLWVADNNGPVWKVTTSGTATKYSISTDNMEAICSDGVHLWTADNSNSVWKVTTAGVGTQYTAGSGNPRDICLGPDGNLWVADATGYVWKVTTGGTITTYALGSSSEPLGICSGPSGMLWVADADGYIWSVTTSNTQTSYLCPGASPQPQNLCTGPDGNVYAVDPYTPAVYQVMLVAPAPSGPPARRSPFTFLFYDFLAGNFIGEIPLTSPTWGSTLNGTGSLRGTIDLTDPRVRALDPRSVIQSGKRAVFVDYGGHLVWGGVTCGPSAFTRSTRQLSFSAMELWGYWARRVQATDYSAPPYSGITGTGSTMPIWGYNGVGSPSYLWDPLLMGAQVIYDSLGVPNGNPLGGMAMCLNGMPISTSTATGSGVPGGYGGTLLPGSYAGVTATATLSSSSLNLTSVTPVAPGSLAMIVNGMAVSGSHIPSNTIVTNVSGSTVTISNMPTSSTTEPNVLFGSGFTPKTDFVSMTFPYKSLQPVSTIIQQLTGLGYGVGFDVGVDVSWPGGFGIPQGTINLNYPQRGQQVAGSIVVNATNCFDYTVTVDASTMANTAYEIGGSNDIVVDQNATPLGAGGGGGYALFENVYNHSQILSPNISAILTQLGIGDLVLGSYPPVTFSVVCDLWGTDPYYGSFKTGDDVRLMIDQDDYFVNVIDQTWRITGYQVNLPDKGAATLTLTIGFPPPSGTYYSAPFINP